jgi:hypothetical protein
MRNPANSIDVTRHQETIDKRRTLARQIKESQPNLSNRAIARMMGASEPTIRRDLAPDKEPLADAGRQPCYPPGTFEHFRVPADIGPEFSFVKGTRAIFNPFEKNWTGEIVLEVSAHGATQAEAIRNVNWLLPLMLSALKREGHAD